MEVWALYAYGAANILQEMMTIKSDDVTGRVKVYESLVKGEELPKSGVPESFRVVIKEFQALGLDITVLNDKGEYVELKDLEEAEKDSYVIESDLESEILKAKNESENLDTELSNELENEEVSEDEEFEKDLDELDYELSNEEEAEDNLEEVLEGEDK